MKLMARIVCLLMITLILGGCQNEAKLNGEKIMNASVSEVGEDWDDIGAELVHFKSSDQEELTTFMQAIKKSRKNPGIVDVAKAEYLLTLELQDGSQAHYYLWLEQDYGAIMDRKDTNTLYSLKPSVLQKLNTYIK